MKKIFTFEEKINKNIALEIFKKQINDDKRFDSEIEENYMSIEEKYISYYFFESTIYNHPYFYKNKQTGMSVDGKMDIHYQRPDPQFILNELNKADAIEIEEEEDYTLYDPNKYTCAYKEFISQIKDKMLLYVTSKHNITPSRFVHIDISPIEGFDNYNVEIYYEKVYVIRYRSQQRKNDFISVISSFNQSFYELDFVKSNEYLEYITKNKRPIEYLPNEYLSFYYIDSFEVYRNISKKLEFEEPKMILKQIKDNINYENYSQYNEYLKCGVYYYKINKYLKKLKVVEKPLKKHIYLAYLTVRHQMNSGLFLYECAMLGLLNKKDSNNKIKFLEYSFRLGSLEAKKKLYEHYSLPLYYNINMINKYS